MFGNSRALSTGEWRVPYAIKDLSLRAHSPSSDFHRWLRESTARTRGTAQYIRSERAPDSTAKSGNFCSCTTSDR